MNMFRNSLNSSLRVLSLRGHSEIGFQSKCWKFFSINNSVQFRKSDGIYKSSNMFDFSEVKDKVGRGEIKNPEFQPGSDINEEDDYSFEFDSVKGNDSGRAGLSRNISGPYNFNWRVYKDENEDEDFEDFPCKRNSLTPGVKEEKNNILENSCGSNVSTNSRFKTGDMNSKSYSDANKKNAVNILEQYSYKYNYNYGGCFGIQDISAIVPSNSPIIRNIIRPPNNLYNKNIFAASGKMFMVNAIENGVQPQRVLYSSPEALSHLKFVLHKIEFYKIDERDLRKYTRATETNIIGVFEKDAINEIAVRFKKELPMTVICYGIQDWIDIGVIAHDAANIGIEKLMLMSGSSRCYEYIADQKYKNALFSMPIYEEVQWNDVDESIDFDHEVFFISPREENSEKKGKRKKSPAIPIADICSTDVWTKKKIFLIISQKMIEEDETLLKYCKKWKARQLILPDVNSFSTLTMASPMLWEIKRQHFFKNLPVSNEEKEE